MTNKLRKIEINILPLILSILLVLISVGVMMSSQFVFTSKQYIGVVCLAISTILYFLNKKFYVVFFALTLTMGLLGLLDFYVTTYKVGFAGAGINPIFLGLIILLLVVSKEQMGGLSYKDAHNGERKLNGALIESLIKDFNAKSDLELNEILNNDSKYTDEAKSAAISILENRGEKKDTKKFRCSVCGEIHDELPALGFKTPFHYDILNEDNKREIAEISSDFCEVHQPEQTDRFIRTVLTIQVNDACENLDYGVWVSLSEESFKEYERNFKKDSEEKVYFGMICNEISDYEESTIGLHVNVKTRNGGIRPEIIPHQNDHNLISDWENGITIKEAEKRVKLTLEAPGNNS